MASNSMGEMIATLRREKGMTQKELADMLNITDKAVSSGNGISLIQILRQFQH